MNREVETHDYPYNGICPVCRGDGALQDPAWVPRENNLGHQGYRPCKKCGGKGTVVIN